MKQLSVLLTLLFFVLIHSTSFALPYTPSPNPAPSELTKEEKKERKLERKQERLIKKKIRKQERKEKRAKKWLTKVKKKWHKWQRKMKKRGFFGGVSDERNFRIGLVLVLGGLAAALIGSIISFNFLNWMGGILALVGLGFIIWSLIEYSS